MSKIININETDQGDWGQFFTNFTVLLEQKTDEQDLLLIDTPTYGKILLLDGVVQVTENDNFIYHEILTHLPILAHGNCTDVLVVGGGDAGIAKEVLKYPNTKCTLVEIDAGVVKFSKQYLQHICEDTFENDRLNLVIEDGCKFVKETNEKYDVIIIDSTDPIGPGKVLFTKEFYTDCKNSLSEGGILVTQNGLPFTQPWELKSSVGYFKDLFTIGTCYTASIPTYVGGPMAFGFATDNTEAHNIDLETLKTRFLSLNIKTKYYNPEVHKAAFALPNYIREIID